MKQVPRFLGLKHNVGYCNHAWDTMFTLHFTCFQDRIQQNLAHIDQASGEGLRGG